MSLASNASLAEFMGILLGDGSIGAYTSKAHGSMKTQYRVKVTGNSTEDHPYLSLFTFRLMSKVMGQEPLIRFKKDENTMELILFGRKYYDEIIESGVRPATKRNNAVIPDFIIDKGLILPFLRGLFDTDGCVVFDRQGGPEYYYPRLELKSAPSPMRAQLKSILYDAGFRVRTYPDVESDGVVRFQMNGKIQLARWHKLIGFNNPRHTTKYLLWKLRGHLSPGTNLQMRLKALSRGGS